MRSLARSNAHFKKASAKLPLGVSSNFRYWGDDKTIYVERGKGARVWDLDGNEYIDYRLAYGPVILGYGEADDGAKSFAVLADALEDSSVYTREGGHDWITWRPLWNEIATDLKF